MTLIELLTSLTILAIIIGLLATTLNTSLDVWRSSQARSRLLTQGRAVMGYIAQDLCQYVADTNRVMTLGNDPTTTYGAANTCLTFSRIQSAPATNQSAIETIYYSIVTNNGVYALSRQTTQVRVSDNLATNSTLILAEGLAALRFTPPADTNALVNGNSPSYLDVYFELLDPPDAHTAAGLSDTDQRIFVERHVVRLSQRVFLPAANRWELP